MLLLLLLACQDYALDGAKQDPSAFDSGVPTDGPDTARSTATDEVCDGVDNDGDGQVDEGFGDQDLDGAADCVDAACALSLADARSVPVDGACSGDTVVVEDPWSVATKWSWSGLSSDPSFSQVMAMPIVAHLTDDDGDGDADEQDVPTVVFPVYARGGWDTDSRVVALSGRDGSEVWSWAGRPLKAGGTPVIADMDGDGWAEIALFTADLRVVLLDHEGAEVWVTPPLDLTMEIGATAVVADLEGDGTPDIIADKAILDGATGTLEAYLDRPLEGHRAPVATDLDGDGIQEILLSGSAYRYDGTHLWTIENLGGCGYFAAVADADGDPSTAEVIWALNERLTIYSADGAELVNVALLDANPPGPPVVADMDGDGVAEIGLAEQSTFDVFEMDGTLLWQAPIDGLYNASTAFDFDGDGAFEPVLADARSLRIYDGATGAVRWEDSTSDSVTYWGNAVVADADADGSAELLLSSTNEYYPGWTGVTLFEHAGAGWAPTGSTWAAHDWAVTNVPDDGSVPVSPVPSYTTQNLFRARPGTGYGVDLSPSIVDACAASCEPDGVVQLSVQVQNTGVNDVAAGVSLAVYRVDGEVWTAVATATVPTAIPAGTAGEGFVLDLRADDFGTYGVALVVDDDGTGRSAVIECDEANNTDTWFESPCR